MTLSPATVTVLDVLALARYLSDEDRHWLGELLSRLEDAPLPEQATLEEAITLYLAERLGQAASEMNHRSASGNAPQESPGQQTDAPPQALPGLPSGSISHGQWLPSLSL